MRSFKRLLKLALIVLGSLALLVLAGAILAQALFQGFLENYVRDELGWSLKIDSAELRFRPLSVRFESIEISVPGRTPFFRARSVYAAVPYSSLWRDEFVVSEVSLDSPHVDLNQLPEQKEAAQATGPPAQIPQFNVRLLTISSAVLNLNSHTIDGIDVHAQVNSAGVELRELKAQFRKLQLAGHGTVRDWNQPELDLDYELSGDLSDVMSLVPEAGNLKSTVSLDGEIKGRLPDVVISGELEKASFTLDESDPFFASARYRYSPMDEKNPIQVEIAWEALSLHLVRSYWKDAPQIASICSGSLKYSGNVTDVWAGTGSISALLSPGPANRRDIIPLGGEFRGVLDDRIFRIQESLLRVRSSTTRLQGSLTDQRLDLKVTLNSPRMGDWVFLEPSLAQVPGAFRLQAQVDGAYQDLRIRAELNGDSEHSSLVAKGNYQTGTGSITAQFEGNATAAEWKPFLPDLSEGNLLFRGSVGGNLKNPFLDLDAEGRDFRYEGLRLNQVQAEVTVRGDLVEFRAEAPDLLFSAEGSYRLRSESFETKGSIAGLTVAKLAESYSGLPDRLQGIVFASFEAKGSAKNWKESDAQVWIEKTEIQWNEARLRIPVGVARLENGMAQVDLQADAQNAVFQLEGTISLRKDFPIDLHLRSDVSAAILERIGEDWKGTGELTADVRITGTVTDPDLEGQIATVNMDLRYLPRDLGIQIARAEAGFSKTRIDVFGDGNLESSSFRWNGRIPLEKSEGMLHLEVADLPIGLLVTHPNLTGRFHVSADFRGEGFPLEEWNPEEKAQLPFHKWSGRLTITPEDFRLGQTALSANEPLQLLLENRIVRLLPSRITAGDLLDFNAEGNLNLETGSVDGSVQTEAMIDLLSSLNANIQSSGPLTLDLKLSGTLEKLQYNGIVELKNGFLRVPDTPVFLEDLELRATLDQTGLRLQRLQARSGGGTITGGGELYPAENAGNLWIKGKHVGMNYPEGLRSQLDFDLKLESQDQDLLLSGDIRVLRSSFEQQLSLRSPIVRKLLASTEEATADKRLKNRIKLALNIKTEQDLLLKNDLANLRGSGNLKVEGSLYRPRLVGRLSIREGSRIFLLGNQYYVEKANVDFFGSELLEPNLDVTLSTLLRDSKTDIFYEVFIPFSGTTSGIEFKNVRSNPSLSEDQVFSLLAQGTVEGDQGGYALAFQRQLLGFLAGQVLGSPGTAVARSIGLSRIQIQQEGLNSVNDPKTRLVLGKDISAGFTLIYSFVLNDPQDQTWIASYRYGRNIVARFIDQDDGSYTVSLSHRIQFGKGIRPDGGIRRRSIDRGPRIQSIDLQNQSPLPEQKVMSLLKTSVGDPYDYWRFQESADQVKRELQNLGYLLPSVDVTEKEEGTLVSLVVRIHPGDRAEMIISGFKPTDKQLNKYGQLWRQGITPSIVQVLIREEMLKELQTDGYHRAAVKTKKEKKGDQTQYYFTVEPGARYASVELQFRGAGHYEPQALQKDLTRLYRSSAAMFVEAVHDSSEFDQRIRSLYAQRGYVLAEVSSDSPEFQADKGRILCRVNIQEGPLSRVAESPSDFALPEELLSQLQLRPGSTFFPDALLEDELKISSFYESRGYPEVVVTHDEELKNGGPEIVLQWSVQTGQLAKIASVRITGNETTDPGLILRMANLSQGDLLSPNKISLARKKVAGLGVFQQVGIATTETDTPGNYHVVISVQESKRYEFQYGGRYNTDDKVGGEIRLSDFNFFGKAQSLSLYVRSSFDRPLFRVDYTLPVTGSIWDRTRLSLFRDRRDDEVEATILQEKIKFPFEITQLALQFQQDRRFGNAYNWIWGLEYGSNEVLFVDLDTLDPVRFEGTVARLRSAFFVEKRDDPLNAQKGYFFSADGEYAPKILGSDISYSKFFSQIFLYKKFGPFVSATGVRAGLLKISSNILTVSEKFRSGGGTTLRGFGLNQVVPGDDPVSIFFGGDSVFILNQEIRYPIYKWFSGAVFYDGGNVYLRASDFNPFELRHSAGFGIRAGTGGFLFRVDLGFNLDPLEDESRTVFHFGIGQAF